MTYRRGLNRFAVFTAASTFLLIVAGGLVTSTVLTLLVLPVLYARFERRRVEF